VTDLYDELGVGKSADKATIRKSYKKKAAKHHPDKGGDVEKFKSLSIAYTVLYDDEARARYDKDGSIKAEPTITQQATGKLAELFVQILKMNIDNLARIDMVSTIKNTIDHNLQSVYQNTAKIEETILNLAATKNRIKSGHHLFKSTIDQEINNLRRSLETEELNIKILETMRELVEDFDYEFEHNLQTFGSTFTSSTSTMI